MVKKTFSLMTLIAAALLVSSLHAQDAKVIAAAKNEGKAVVYGSLETESADAIFKVFRQKTGIELDYWRASSTKAMDRALSEYRAGRPLFDAVLTNDNPMQIMLKEDILAKYDSPSAKEFTKESIDPELGPRYRNVVIGILYNKSMIKPADAPKSLEDLLKPQFRGKIVMPDPTQHTTTAQWLASLEKLLGKDKADKYIRDLAAMKPIFVESLLPAAERVASARPRWE
jgi:iron(III) transport system substrate-binding protein